MSTKEQKLVAEVQSNFQNATSAYAKSRREALEDYKFYTGDQWENESIVSIPITQNLLTPYVNTILSEYENDNAAIRVMPSGSDTSDKSAQIVGGLITAIEQNSGSEAVYNQALRNSVVRGEGYIFIDTEYASDESFDQNLVLKGCKCPEEVYLDPSHQELDGSDANWALIVQDIDRATYEEEYGEVGHGIGYGTGWLGQDTVRVAKYFRKVRAKKTLSQYLDENFNAITTTDAVPEGLQVLNKRTVFETEIEVYLVDGKQILEQSKFPGKFIPIVKVTGEEHIVNGTRTTHGVIRHVKDAQKSYNLACSKETEIMLKTAINPWVGTTKQFGDKADDWANAHTSDVGVLMYENDSNAPGAPTKAPSIDSSAFGAIQTSKNSAMETLKMTFGLHDSALGKQDNAQSGIAIQIRADQSNKSNSIYYSNFKQSLRHIGRILVGAIPTYYDTERTVRIVGSTLESKIFKIDPTTFSSGSYEVVINTGPAYASKRQQALDSLMAITQVNPQAAGILGDLLASQVDSPIADKVAARLKATIPQEVLAATGELDNEEMEPKEKAAALQQQLAQAQKQMEQMQLQLEEQKIHIAKLTDDASLKLTLAQMDNELDHKKLEQQDAEAELEARLKIRELELAEKKLELANKELDMKLLLAANSVNERPNRSDYPAIASIDTNIDTNLGGSVTE